MMQTPLPWIELFEVMRRALGPLGIALGVEHYDWLRQAMGKGYGGASWDGTSIASWENLRRLKVFDRTFDAYRAEYQDCLPLVVSEPEVESNVDVKETSVEIDWPMIPLPKGYENTAIETGNVKTLGAFQASVSEVNSDQYRLSPQDLPLTLATVQRNWRSLRQSVREGGDDELDIEATVAQMIDRGFLDDVVWRPGRRRRAELVVLVDDSAVMLPLQWAIAPLIRAVEERWVSPAQIYRFTTYPDRFLYGWARSSEATAIEAVLSRLSRSRTVLVVVSDAGAAMGIVRGERIVGSLDFALRALPCVRQLIWLNPWPRERWVGNSAQAIDAGLLGRMLPLDEFEVTALRSRELGGVLV
jgi:uncharacterized protein